MGNKRRILIISAVSGSGHKVTAQALASVLKARHFVDVVPVHRMLGVFDYLGELFYNLCLMHGGNRLIAPYHQVSKKLIRLYRPVLLDTIRRYFTNHKYDCIVSCIPWVNHYFIAALPDTPIVTVITDFCSSSTHPWIQHKKQRLICPTEKSVRQARDFGIPEGNIFPVSGNIISPLFYSKNQVIRDKPSTLESLGLDPEKKTALVFYGGYGPNDMEKLVVDGWNFILIWGKNSKRIKKPLCLNVGFTNEIPFYMGLADLLIGKPGPGVIAEAVHCNLPVLVDAASKSLLPQEKDVLEWIIRNDIGGVFLSRYDYRRKIARIRDPETARWKKNAGQLVNNALFETADIIEHVVDGKEAIY